MGTTLSNSPATITFKGSVISLTIIPSSFIDCNKAIGPPSGATSALPSCTPNWPKPPSPPAIPNILVKTSPISPSVPPVNPRVAFDACCIASNNFASSTLPVLISLAISTNPSLCNKLVLVLGSAIMEANFPIESPNCAPILPVKLVTAIGPAIPNMPKVAILLES